MRRLGHTQPKPTSCHNCEYYVKKGGTLGWCAAKKDTITDAYASDSHKCCSPKQPDADKNTDNDNRQGRLF